MFSAPTAVRVLKKQDPALLKKYDLSSLRALFLAGEPLDEPTARWISDGLGVPIIDNYWQTEIGLADPHHRQRRGDASASKFGSPGVPMYGYEVKILHESTGEELTGAEREGRGRDRGPDAAGLHADRLAGRRALRQHLLEEHPGQAGLFHLRLGHPRRGRLLLHPGPHRRRDQRGRPSPGHARDRGKHLRPCQRGRGGGGRRGRRAQGPGGHGLRRAEGRGACSATPQAAR